MCDRKASPSLKTENVRVLAARPWIGSSCAPPGCCNTSPDISTGATCFASRQCAQRFAPHSTTKLSGAGRHSHCCRASTRFLPWCIRLLSSGNSRERRVDLEALSTRTLRDLTSQYRLDTRLCVEKAEVVALIHKFETRRKRPLECVPRFALRMAWLDRKRNLIYRTDLVGTRWNIRVRADGQLAHLMNDDPFFNNLPAAGVVFSQDGRVDFLDGPFRWMNAGGGGLFFNLVSRLRAL